MLTKKFCPECGEEIGFDYVTPTKSFLIDEMGDGSWTIMKNDNNDAWCPNGDNPYFEFHCLNDMEHKLSKDSEFEEWKDEVIKYFYEFCKR